MLIFIWAGIGAAQLVTSKLIIDYVTVKNLDQIIVKGVEGILNPFQFDKFHGLVTTQNLLPALPREQQKELQFQLNERGILIELQQSFHLDSVNISHHRVGVVVLILDSNSTNEVIKKVIQQISTPHSLSHLN